MRDGGHVKFIPAAGFSFTTTITGLSNCIVVQGAARITCGERVFMLFEKQSTYHPAGQDSSARNPGKTPLEFIEVQSGDYFGKADTIGIDDEYRRV